MLETILLFEPDDSFCDSSVVEAVMEDFHDSGGSFDSWEYAHGGNCRPDGADINFELTTSDHSAESNGDTPLTLQELEQQVREQQAREFYEKRHSDAPAVAETLVEEAEKTETAATNNSTTKATQEGYRERSSSVEKMGKIKVQIKRMLRIS